MFEIIVNHTLCGEATLVKQDIKQVNKAINDWIMGKDIYNREQNFYVENKYIDSIQIKRK